jgi:hypothetical protein
MSALGWRILADATVAVHYGFLAYLALGGFLAWRWPRTMVAHIAAAVWAVLIVTTSVPCPLTAAQNNFRERAGLPPLQHGFIQLYVRGVLYTSSTELLAQCLLAAVVLLSWAVLLNRVRIVRRVAANMY